MLQAAAGSPAELEALLHRRAAGEPLERVVGWAEFCGLRIAVRGGVFIPRRRTEWLARQAVRLARPGSVVVDMCCGSGAIAAAIAATLAPQRCQLWAADLDPVAVECARHNLTGAGARVVQGDLFAALPSSLRAGIDVLVANVPYVPSRAIASLPAEARDYEPADALDGGPDGLDVFRRIATAGDEWLAPGGSLLTELTEAQLDAAVELLADRGLDAQVSRDDATEACVVIAARPA